MKKPISICLVYRGDSTVSESPLIFSRDNLAAQRYIQEIVELHVLSYQNPIFEKDNAEPNIPRITFECFQYFDVNLLLWVP